MANPNIIQFSLPELDRQKLQSLSIDGEASLNLTAKRLLNSILNGVDINIPDDTAKALGDRLSALESSLNSPAVPDDIGDRLEKMERHLDWCKREILNAQAKFKEIDHDLYWGESLSFQEIRKDIQRINEAIRMSQPETAIMIQKKPLDPVVPEITLDHIQASKEFEKALTTIKKWASDPNKWPEGWIYDGDRQFWVKTA